MSELISAALGVLSGFRDEVTSWTNQGVLKTLDDHITQIKTAAAEDVHAGETAVKAVFGELYAALHGQNVAAPAAPAAPAEPESPAAPAEPVAPSPAAASPTAPVAADPTPAPSTTTEASSAPSSTPSDSTSTETTGATPAA